LIVDVHCHVIVEEMTAPAVPENWRPAVRRENGRYRLAFRGRDISSVVSEFTDVGAMLGAAAATSVDHLLLSPWISLVPTEAEPAEARAVCEVHNTALAAITAAHPGRVSAVGAVVLQDPPLAARQVADLMTSQLRADRRVRSATYRVESDVVISSLISEKPFVYALPS